jgi:hypothetical protein
VKTNNNILHKFSSHVFWNCDISKLDIKRDKKIIIERVLECGIEADEKLIYKIYNYNIIKQIAINDVNLNNDRSLYLSIIFKTKQNIFKCYNNVLLYNKLIGENNA